MVEGNVSSVSSGVAAGNGKANDELALVKTQLKLFPEKTRKSLEYIFSKYLSRDLKEVALGVYADKNGARFTISSIRLINKRDYTSKDAPTDKNPADLDRYVYEITLKGPESRTLMIEAIDGGAVYLNLESANENDAFIVKQQLSEFSKMTREKLNYIVSKYLFHGSSNVQEVSPGIFKDSASGQNVRITRILLVDRRNNSEELAPFGERSLKLDRDPVESFMYRITFEEELKPRVILDIEAKEGGRVYGGI